jgi:hypothetical protein
MIFRRRLFVAFLPVTAIIASATVASAAVLNDPYPAGHIGYDVSYPQCPPTTAPPGDFGIIGVNGGRPFSNNGCLAKEISDAPTTTMPPSLYLNTGYSGAYRRQIISSCSTASASVGGTSTQKEAWAIGCSEAANSMTYAFNNGASGTNVAMWWLDVETGNSWSSSNLSLNQYTINGAAARLASTSMPVGVYSSASMWTAITGSTNFTPTNIAAIWEASGGSCTPSFTSLRVWLLQSVTSGVDSDYAC